MIKKCYMGREEHKISWSIYQERLADEDPHYKMYYSTNLLVKWLFWKRFEVVYKIIKNKKGKILDVGCGEGFFLQRIKDSDLELYGIDISKKRIKRAFKRASNAKLFCGDISCMPFKAKSFDIIVCFDVLEHVPNYVQIIKEIKRVTKKNGMIFIGIPNEKLWVICRALLLRFPPKEPQHINSFSIKELNKLFNLQNNFKKYIPFQYFCLSRIIEYNVK